MAPGKESRRAVVVGMSNGLPRNEAFFQNNPNNPPHPPHEEKNHAGNASNSRISEAFRKNIHPPHSPHIAPTHSFKVWGCGRLVWGWCGFQDGTNGLRNHLNRKALQMAIFAHVGDVGDVGVENAKGPGARGAAGPEP